jgi:alpha-beta hydrolase superfamily lysophospholipase
VERTACSAATAEGARASIVVAAGGVRFQEETFLRDMSAIPIVERFVELDRGSDEPLYFASDGHRLFGWLHRPARERTANTAVVICQPFGYEAVSAHRCVRAFARVTAASGFPTLRFDYLGTGDSEEIDAQAEQLERWTRDVIAAVAEVRRRTGVEHVCLLGFRLGALLAVLAAQRCEEVKALMLFAPVVSGPRYLRELRTMRLAALLESHFDEESGSAGSAGVAGEACLEEGSIEVSGFLLSAATVSALSRLDLMSAGTPQVAEALVIDRIDLPMAREWTEAIARLGVNTRYVALQGFVEMMMAASPSAAVPEAVMATVTDWLLPFQLPARGRHVEAPRVAAPSPALSIAVDEIRDNALTERPVLFGADDSVFGILTEPREGEARRRAVILLNAGAVYHIGASRMYVSLARRWAGRGYVVLRMDFAGLGDSPTRAGRPDNEVFPPDALDDILAAIELVRARYRVQDITLAGLCSGAYHSLRAAVAGAPVKRILLVNPQTFFWKEGATLQDIQLTEVVSSPGAYRKRLLSLVHWRKLLSGQVDVWRILRVFMQRLNLALESQSRELARRLGIRLAHDLGSELEEIGARGVRTVVVFARGEPGIDLLRLQGGSSIKRLRDRCRIHIINSADHTFTRMGPRAALEDILSEELFAVH